MFLKKWSLLFFSILLLACSASEHSNPTIKRDLGAILKDGKLRVSTSYSSTSYFLYRGETLGFEYEMLSRFAKHLGVELEIVVATDIDSLIPNLIVGKVDLMGHGLTITKNRQQQVAFSEPIYLTHQVLVQKKPENWRKMKLHEIDEYLIRDVVDLEGKTISVRAKTSYYERLKNLSEEIGASITIEKLDGTLTTDEIIEMVADGQIEYTISDENLASLLAASYPILDVRVPVGLLQKSAWAVRKNSPKLLSKLDSWLIDFKKTADYNVIYKKYFKNKRSFRKRVKSDFYSLKTNSISKYDDLVKKESEKLGWDWRLVSALIYQESQFEVHAKSWVGAGGLMQMMPATAKEMGVKNRFDPEDNLAGGTKYLKVLFNRFDKIIDEEQRIKFAMASYNCGYSHVLDAQKLAKENGLEYLKWDDNVAEMILALSSPENYNKSFIKYGYVRGIEPYTYVKEIFERYTHYRGFIKE
ncbi:MAG: transporter substrate-binding domain-containing protein [Flavobacteriaceae bacterium]